MFDMCIISSPFYYQLFPLIFNLLTSFNHRLSFLIKSYMWDLLRMKNIRLKFGLQCRLVIYLFGFSIIPSYPLCIIKIAEIERVRLVSWIVSETKTTSTEESNYGDIV